jgi:hypothetical protein
MKKRRKKEEKKKERRKEGRRKKRKEEREEGMICEIFVIYYLINVKKKIVFSVIFDLCILRAFSILCVFSVFSILCVFSQRFRFCVYSQYFRFCMYSHLCVKTLFLSSFSLLSMRIEVLTSPPTQHSSLKNGSLIV